MLTWLSWCLLVFPLRSRQLELEDKQSMLELELRKYMELNGVYFGVLAPREHVCCWRCVNRPFESKETWKQAAVVFSQGWENDSSFSSETKHWCILNIRSSFFRQTIPASHQLPQIMLHYGSICSVHVARLVSFKSVYSVLVITHRYRLKTLLTCLYVNEYENIIRLL